MLTKSQQLFDIINNFEYSSITSPSAMHHEQRVNMIDKSTCPIVRTFVDTRNPTEDYDVYVLDLINRIQDVIRTLTDMVEDGDTDDLRYLRLRAIDSIYQHACGYFDTLIRSNKRQEYFLAKNELYGKSDIHTIPHDFSHVRDLSTREYLAIEPHKYNDKTMVMVRGAPKRNLVVHDLDLYDVLEHNIAFILVATHVVGVMSRTVDTIDDIHLYTQKAKTRAWEDDINAVLYATRSGAIMDVIPRWYLDGNVSIEETLRTAIAKADERFYWTERILSGK